MVIFGVNRKVIVVSWIMGVYGWGGVVLVVGVVFIMNLNVGGGVVCVVVDGVLYLFEYGVDLDEIFLCVGVG